MNTRWLIGIGVVVILLVIGERMRWPRKPETLVPAPELPQPAQSEVPGHGETGVVKSATAPPARPSITAPDPAVLAVAERGRPGQPWTWARVSEVPPLDPVTQAELIRRCRALASPTDRLPMAHLLALGGDAEAVSLLIEFATRDYAGQVLDARDAWALRLVLAGLGIAAQRSPEALAFLEMACWPEFWTETNLWKDAEEDLQEVRRRMMEGAIIGLAWSGSPVAAQVLEKFREDANRAAEMGVGGGIGDSAFILYYLREHGLETTVGELLLADLDTRMRALWQWRGTKEGREWRRWGNEVLAIETRRAQTQSTPSP